MVLSVLFAAPARSDDHALRRDGTRVEGRLSWTAGRFAFRTSAGDEPVAALELVRFNPKSIDPPPAALRMQVRLADGEILLVEAVKLAATHLHVRPTWGGPLAVPRTAIDGVGHEPGWQPIAVVRPAQGHEQKPPLSAGRVGVGFTGGRTTDSRTTLVLGFAGGDLRIDLAGPDERIAVTSPVKAEYAGAVTRDATPHRLTVEFDADRLTVLVDTAVLWAQPRGPGELRSLKVEGTAAVADAIVTRPARPGPPKAWADLTADGVRSPDGDEAFGTLTAIGPTGVTLGLKARPVEFPWPDVAELAFRRGPLPERPTTGEHVRLRVRAGAHRDVLAGAVKAFNDKEVVLAHPVLGDLTVPRDQLEEARFTFHGRRVPVESGPHHLGTRPAFGFAVPKPTGLKLTKRVTVEPVPPTGFVVVTAARVGRTGTPVEVCLNGDPLGTLNALADRADEVVRSYRLPIPPKAWRAGTNEVEVRLKTDPDAKATGVDVRGVRLELHDGR